MSVEVRVVEPVAARDAARWLAAQSPDAHFFCPFRLQFIKWPELAGEVDPAWIAAHSPLYQDRFPHPPLGTPLLKSRYSDETCPVSMISVIHQVQGERVMMQREQALVVGLRQQLAFAEAHGMAQKNMLDAVIAEKNEMSNRIGELEQTIEDYAGMLRSMQMCIEVKSRELEELTRQLAEQEESISKLKASEMRLSSEHITLKQNGEQDKELIARLEKSNGEMSQREDGLKRELEELRKKVEELTAAPVRKRAKERKVETLLASEEPAQTDEELDEQDGYVTEDADVVKKLLTANNLQAVHKYNESTMGLTLFDSVSDQLKRDSGIEHSPTELLSDVIKFIELRQELYEQKLLETKKKKETFSMYLNSIRKGDVSEITVEALANSLERHIWLYTSKDIQKFDNFESTDAPLKIAYFTGVLCFYRSTEPLNTVIDVE